MPLPQTGQRITLPDVHTVLTVDPEYIAENPMSLGGRSSLYLNPSIYYRLYLGCDVLISQMGGMPNYWPHDSDPLQNYLERHYRRPLSDAYSPFEPSMGVWAYSLWPTLTPNDLALTTTALSSSSSGRPGWAPQYLIRGATHLFGAHHVQIVSDKVASVTYWVKKLGPNQPAWLLPPLTYDANHAKWMNLSRFFSGPMVEDMSTWNHFAIMVMLMLSAHQPDHNPINWDASLFPPSLGERNSDGHIIIGSLQSEDGTFYNVSTHTVHNYDEEEEEEEEEYESTDFQDEEVPVLEEGSEPVPLPPSPIRFTNLATTSTAPVPPTPPRDFRSSEFMQQLNDDGQEMRIRMRVAQERARTNPLVRDTSQNEVEAVDRNVRWEQRRNREFGIEED